MLNTDRAPDPSGRVLYHAADWKRSSLPVTVERQIGGHLPLSVNIMMMQECNVTVSVFRYSIRDVVCLHSIVNNYCISPGQWVPMIICFCSPSSKLKLLHIGCGFLATRATNAQKLQ